MANKRSILKYIFLGFVLVLAGLVAAALIYVNSALELYEKEHPNRQLEKAVELLKTEAADGTLWEKEGVPDMIGGVYEASENPKESFVNMLNGEISFSSPKWIDESRCKYNIISNGLIIAEVTLQKNGDAQQKLGIISIQKYDLVSYVPVSHNFTLKLPKDVLLNSEVFVSVNGKELTEADGKVNYAGELVFTFENIYTTPYIEVTDVKGNTVTGNLPDKIDGEITYDNCFYTLTLPEFLNVTLDGEKLTGEVTDDERNYYRIRLARRAEVKIEDLFGNTVDYAGSSSIPLTYYVFTVADDCKITVDGKDAPEAAIKVTTNKEYESLREYVPDLPNHPEYNIVVLKNDAEIKIVDKNGNDVPFDKDVKVQDLTYNPLAEVPEEIANEVDVLEKLENWSLFMSSDLTFAALSKDLISSSSLYAEAKKYNSSIDKTFFSKHTLLNPPFIDEKVTNFVKFNDNAFSVDISFTKQMRVAGKVMDDSMNERCYFAKYEGKWKLVCMKEILEDGE